MKNRFILLVVVLLGVFCFYSCKKRDKKPKDNDKTNQTYTITWKNYDNSILRKDKVKYGKIPDYIAPLYRPSTKEYSYVFTGWDKEVTSATSDNTYVAQFKQVKKKYKITWKNYDESILKIDYVEYGKLPVYNGILPKIPANNDFSAKFVGWDKDISTVNGEEEYIATFKKTFTTTYLEKMKKLEEKFLFSFYTPDEKSYSIKWNGNYKFSDELVIPSEYMGKPISNISDKAFAELKTTGSVRISIPNSVISIGEDAFLGCARHQISVDNANPNYDSRENCNAIIEKSSNKLILGCHNTTIPDGVASIDKNAFSRTPLSSLVIPSSVISIGENAFYNCYNLRELVIPNGVAIIGKKAFHYCTQLASITISKSVVSIGEDAFLECGRLLQINVDKDNPNYDSREDCDAIIEKSSNELILGCLYTKIPNGVVSIGKKAFYNCYYTLSLNIPKSLVSISDDAFLYCRISEIKVDNDNPIYDSRENCNALIEKSSNKLILGSEKTVIPDSVVSIGKKAFYYCTILKSITIPKSVVSISEDAFLECSSLKKIEVDNANPIYDSRDNCNAIIEKTTNTLVLGCKNTIIPNTVKNIGKNAFSNCVQLETITIPNSVENIADNAFYCCYRLKTITIPNGVVSIGEKAFYDCRSLTSIKIPSSVVSIGEDAFLECSSLEEIKVDNENPYYDSRDNCNALIETSTNTLILGCKNTIIPNGVIHIGKSAFYRCLELKSVTIPNGVLSICKEAFAGCSKLHSLTLPSSLKSIGEKAFLWCYSLQSVIIPNSVESIDEGAFYWFTNEQAIFFETKNKHNEWNLNWNKKCTAKIYWYSESPNKDGNHWHYVNGICTIWE